MRTKQELLPEFLIDYLNSQSGLKNQNHMFPTPGLRLPKSVLELRVVQSITTVKIQEIDGFSYSGVTHNTATTNFSHRKHNSDSWLICQCHPVTFFGTFLSLKRKSKLHGSCLLHSCYGPHL